MAITYKDAGVDVEAGYRAVKLMREDVQSTYSPNVLNSLANFGGLYALDASDLAKNPVLVAGSDGVGTKLNLAVALDKHDTIGIDCVAMCVNDIVCLGARPLFFLDYIASDKLIPERVAEIVKGIADGCKQSGCALLGGETAEMPGMYKDEDYDVAGFAVGIVDRNAIIDGKRIQEGDALIGLASSGVHSNGFSLVRRLFPVENQVMARHSNELNMSLGEAFLQPTRIYVKTILSLIQTYDIRGIAHITGGGFYENIPRMIPEGLGVRIDLGAWRIPPLFCLLQKEGDLDRDSMFNTFNMGIGMVLAVPAAQQEDILAALSALGESAYVIGRVTDAPGVQLCE